MQAALDEDFLFLLYDVARTMRIPLLGVLLAGVLAGLGGGMVRDVLLGLEPAAITTWYYIPAVLAAGVKGDPVPADVAPRHPGG